MALQVGLQRVGRAGVQPMASRRVVATVQPQSRREFGEGVQQVVQLGIEGRGEQLGGGGGGVGGGGRDKDATNSGLGTKRMMWRWRQVTTQQSNRSNRGKEDTT